MKKLNRFRLFNYKPSDGKTGLFSRSYKAGSKFLALFAFLLITPLYGQLDIGSDVVSRYVWRGTDFGNAASIQPYISYASGGLEIGAWSSWALTSGGANENDLYVAYSFGPAGIAVTDYYFPISAGIPGSDFFDYDSETGSHILEVSGSVATGPVGFLAAMNFHGDPDNSLYVEGSYTILDEEDMSASLTIGAGNEAYVTDEEGGFSAVNIALSVTKDMYMASYIINPEAKIAFLVFGISL